MAVSLQTPPAQPTVRLDPTLRIALTCLIAWLLIIVALSMGGYLHPSGPFSPPLAATETLLVVIAAFAAWPGLRNLIAAVGIRRLTAIHISRAAATPLFLWYGAQGLLPQRFALRAGWGDLIAALAALLAVTFWRKPAGYLVAQLVGLADFIEAFAVAIPEARHNPAAMHQVTVLPLSLIPFYLVRCLSSLSTSSACLQQLT